MRYRIVHLTPFALVLVAACGGDPTGARVPKVDPRSSAASSARQGGDAVTPSFVRLGTPSFLQLRLFELWGGPNADCSGAIRLRSSGSTPVANDFVARPTVPLLAHATTTYRCLVLVMEDVLDFRSPSTLGPCIGGVLLQYDIYRAPETDWRDMTLAPIVAHGSFATPVVDKVPLLFAENPAAAAARGFSSNQILQLSNTAVVPGPLRLRVDATNALVDDGGVCSIQPTSATFF